MCKISKFKVPTPEYLNSRWFSLFLNMSKVHYAPFLAILLLLLLQYYSVTATVNLTNPIISPGDPCHENVCGRGDCIPSEDSTFGFECECQPGWRQARSDTDANFRFLPCVIPDCTLSTCANDARPSPQERRPDLSVFDPCYWSDCGGGICVQTSSFTHNCVCDDGYYNLLNITAFPCYRDCASGEDCPDLGLGFPGSRSGNDGDRFSNDTDRSGNNRDRSDNDRDRFLNGASLIPKVECAWLITMVTALALVMC
ncbi:hypothetical protein ACJIZ3_017566 [Penstemon smallii]|uniref:EGF-like domain-containing protein n=1 Tax=Penstemon smallii TaxID=265156 RepID=A0ABD3SVX8_9LAMI